MQTRGGKSQSRSIMDHGRQQEFYTGVNISFVGTGLAMTPKFKKCYDFKCVTQASISEIVNFVVTSLDKNKKSQLRIVTNQHIGKHAQNLGGQMPHDSLWTPVTLMQPTHHTKEIRSLSHLTLIKKTPLIKRNRRAWTTKTIVKSRKLQRNVLLRHLFSGQKSLYK